MQEHSLRDSTRLLRLRLRLRLRLLLLGLCLLLLRLLLPLLTLLHKEEAAVRRGHKLGLRALTVELVEAVVPNHIEHRHVVGHELRLRLCLRLDLGLLLHRALVEELRRELGLLPLHHNELVLRLLLLVLVLPVDHLRAVQHLVPLRGDGAVHHEARAVSQVALPEAALVALLPRVVHPEAATLGTAAALALRALALALACAVLAAAGHLVVAGHAAVLLSVLRLALARVLLVRGVRHLLVQVGLLPEAGGVVLAALQADDGRLVGVHRPHELVLVARQEAHEDGQRRRQEGGEGHVVRELVEQVALVHVLRTQDRVQVLVQADLRVRHRQVRAELALPGLQDDAGLRRHGLLLQRLVAEGEEREDVLVRVEEVLQVAVLAADDELVQLRQLLLQDVVREGRRDRPAARVHLLVGDDLTQRLEHLLLLVAHDARGVVLQVQRHVRGDETDNVVDEVRLHARVQVLERHIVLVPLPREPHRALDARVARQRNVQPRHQQADRRQPCVALVHRVRTGLQGRGQNVHCALGRRASLVLRETHPHQLEAVHDERDALVDNRIGLRGAVPRAEKRRHAGAVDKRRCLVVSDNRFLLWGGAAGGNQRDERPGLGLLREASEDVGRRLLGRRIRVIRAPRRVGCVNAQDVGDRHRTSMRLFGANTRDERRAVFVRCLVCLVVQ
eukprot:Rhum_TRINITY_DN14800_c8_g1::Rhum_TRINITY_DN14800_c8_g1_i1::g.121270::m.121270